METQLNRIESDFVEGNGPFADVQFPEERLLEELPHNSMEDRATLASIFSTFDYNRDANQLVDNLVELYEAERRYFDAYKVPLVANEEELADAFKEIGFRYPSRDAHAWCTNCQILRENYSGKWTELLLEARLDAPSLVSILNDRDFLCLKGVKIAPMYARILNDSVTPLYNLWELDIPVDTHIRRLSKDLFHSENDVFRLGPEPSDDDIRGAWRIVGDKTNISRHVVDGALWHIGNKWDEWGEDYWNEVTA